MINIAAVGITLTKLANTKVKREVLVVFINFSPLLVHKVQKFEPAMRISAWHNLNPI